MLHVSATTSCNHPVTPLIPLPRSQRNGGHRHVPVRPWYTRVAGTYGVVGAAAAPATRSSSRTGTAGQATRVWARMAAPRAHEGRGPRVVQALAPSAPRQSDSTPQEARGAERGRLPGPRWRSVAEKAEADEADSLPQPVPA